MTTYIEREKKHIGERKKYIERGKKREQNPS
jgi:hypothetical protein